MKVPAVLLAIGFSAACAGAQVHCTANIEGFHIRTVYVMGSSYKAVAWAYKNLSNESCLTPVTDPSKADAILSLDRPADSPSEPQDAPISVTCTDLRGGTQCLDSDGNEMDVSCDRAGSCSSYYGPAPGAAIGGALKEAFITSAVYAARARIYTRDHKLVWDSAMVKGSLWQTKIYQPPLAPACKLPSAWSSGQYHFHFRDWAQKHCGISFDPLVSIDLRALEQASTESARQADLDAMRKDAQEAAAR